MSDPPDIRYWADRFALFGDPNRLTLLLTIRRAGSITVSDLADACGIRLTTVSHALRLLRAHDLVHAERDERDGRMIHYTLTDHSVHAILDFVVAAELTHQDHHLSGNHYQQQR